MATSLIVPCTGHTSEHNHIFCIKSMTQFIPANENTLPALLRNTFAVPLRTRNWVNSSRLHSVLPPPQYTNQFFNRGASVNTLIAHLCTCTVKVDSELNGYMHGSSSHTASRKLNSQTGTINAIHAFFDTLRHQEIVGSCYISLGTDQMHKRETIYSQIDELHVLPHRYSRLGLRCVPSSVAVSTSAMDVQKLFTRSKR